jgi:formylglycine-generating enzyme required for sulfatase activity
MNIFSKAVLAACVLAAVAGLTLAMGMFGQPPAPEKKPDPNLTWVQVPNASYSIAATEVTVAQFRLCAEAGACDVSQVESICNYGKTDREQHPLNCVSFYGAEQFCAFAGGRLCSEVEWISACAGPEGRGFPYGNEFDLKACNVQSNTRKVEGRERSTAPVATHPGCEGGLKGLFDMAGNVSEWVSDCKETYCRFRGAGFISNDPIDMFASCGSACSGNQKTLKSNTVGIRCCRDNPSDQKKR